MDKFLKWMGDKSSNLLATAYIIVVQVITPIFHLCKIWLPGKKWPTKCLIAIDKPAKLLREAMSKHKEEKK